MTIDRSSTGELSRREFIAAGAAIAGAAVMHPFSARAATDQAHLRLMGTTDLHVYVYPYDYYADQELESVGLARTAAHIARVRAEATNSLLFDNGDFLQGNPMGDYIAHERGMEDGAIHPIIAAMNVLKYDVGTLGNHEFNYGLTFMHRVTRRATFPIVSANLVRGELADSPLDDERFGPPFVILDRQIELGDGSRRPLRVGVIGFLPPQITVWDAHHLAGQATTRDIVEAARAFVPRMKEQGADLIVALAHTGIAAPSADDVMMENAALQLATVDGIDAIFAGHQHLRFPGKDFEGIEHVDATLGTLHGTPAVMPGFWGSDLGVIDLLVQHDGSRWRVAEASTALMPISERKDHKTTALVESDAEVIEAVRADHEATLDYVRRPVGELTGPLHSYFALVADDPSVQIVNRAQQWYAQGVLPAAGLGDLPLLSAAAPFKSGGRSGPGYYTDIAPGPIAIRNVADLYLYPNTVQVVKVTGDEVREWLEMSAGIFNTLQPSVDDQPLLRAGFASYNFDIIDGVTYRIDLTRPARYDPDGKLVEAGSHRIVDLAYDGAPIDGAAEFLVVTNNYRAGGGGKFPNLSPARVVFVAPDANRDVLARYIVEQETIDPKADGNWSFEPAPGHAAIFDTGPRSQDHLGDVSQLDLSPVGDTPDGYRRYRLTLG